MPFRRWLPNVVLALAVAGLLVTFRGDARLEAQPGCTALDALLGRIGENTALVALRILEGRKREFAAAFFNALPPPSDTEWESAYLAIRSDGFAILMVGFTGTVCAHVVIRRKALPVILKDLDGVEV